MSRAEFDERSHKLKSYAALLREARAHAVGAMSKRPGSDLGDIVNNLGALESQAMRELMALVKKGEG